MLPGLMLPGNAANSKCRPLALMLTLDMTVRERMLVSDSNVTNNLCESMPLKNHMKTCIVERHDSKGL
jgi:hypothetical protein